MWEILMNPVTETLLGAALVVVSRVLWLLALWLHLRGRVRQEHAHREYVTALADRLPNGSRVEERRSDGSHLHLVIDSIERGPSQEAAGGQ
jgi:hypothetical protein